MSAGLFNTLIRTDTQLVTKSSIVAATGTLTYYKNLDDFDAVVLFVEGAPPLNSQQRSNLLEFVRSGKGLMAIHTTVTAFSSWREFSDLLGINRDARATVEGDDEEVTRSRLNRFFPEPFRIIERIAPLKLRPGTRVLASSQIAPAVWTTRHGKGRVIVSQLGHKDETWDRKDFQILILEGLRWIMRAK